MEYALLCSAVADVHIHLFDTWPNSMADVHMYMSEVVWPMHVQRGQSTASLLNISVKPGQTSASTALAESWSKRGPSTILWPAYL